MKTDSFYKLFRSPSYGAVVLLVCLCLAAQPAGAQYPVTDVAAIAKNVEQFLKEGAQWAKENLQAARDFTKQQEQLAQQIKDYQSTLAKYASILDGVKFLVPDGVPLTSVGANYLVDEACPTTTGGAMSSLIGMLPSLNLSGGTKIDYREKQHQICVAMQQTRNKKFNASLQYLNETLPEIKNLHAQMEARHDGTSELGDATANINENALAQKRVDDAYTEFQLKSKGYDQYLDTLQQSQVTLAQLALKGRRVTAMRSMVSNAALMDGLDVSSSDVLP